MARKETSEQLCKRIAEKSNGVCIISFSMGKDSIAAYLQAKKHFHTIHLVYYYMIPDLQFQKQSLRYYEQKFGQRILEFPSVHLYTQLNGCMYQTPDRLDTLWDLNIYEANHDEIFAAAKSDLGVPQETYVGLGVRSSDSLNRRMSIDTYGAENIQRRQFFPIFDWNIADIEQSIKAADVRLPIDYEIWGRSFDGVQMSFLEGVRHHFPEDYKKILEWFPLAEMDFLRYRDYADYNPFNV